MSVINKIKIGTGAEVDIGVTWSNISGKPSTFTPATHTHSYAGSSSAGGPATSANTLLTKSSSTNADLFVTFVDSNNSTAANESVYTDGDLKYNPSTNTLTAGTFKGSLSGNASTATTATKLGTSTVGGTTTPIYLNAGTPTALSYTIAKSVPSNAVFTDTHYKAVPVLGATDATSNATSATSNPYLNIVENSTKSGGIQIKGSGATTVSATNGIVTISSTDTNTTYSVMTGATSSAAGKSGLVPAPASGKQTSFLRGDGTWVIPTNTTYGLVGAQNTTGLIKNGSSITSASGYTACPIVSGIPYYKDTNTTSVSATTTGSGNAVTAISASGSVISVTKGASYLPLGGGTVTGATLFTNTTASTSTSTGAVKISGGLGVAGNIYGGKVYGAVWNDLADSIIVDDDCNLEHGYCYCFDGEKYTKSSKYLDDGIIGIHSDTYGFKMGSEENKKKMDVAVSGFVLAYVDKEYKPGTPLTCTENGYLTEIKKEDKIEYPEKIVATYWKNEPAEEWGSKERKVKVNGRKWVKIK